MNTYDKNERGISGGSFDRWVEKNDAGNESTITKMQHHFWVTKQTLSRKLGKKEDECIVSSDAELDAKLELFRSIQESCAFLQRVIDKYQERLCKLAQEENAMGRFLKESGKEDKTRAGKMMSAVGKSLSYSGQQRLTLRGPLVRLYQEVETFRQRAIEDTLQKVQAMEKARTEYRAALSWMKNVSQELDPDTSKQLERFRKVQTRVRRGKASFDSLTLDSLQKIDLLAAARCNMFSHALVMYQNSLLNFTKKSAQAYSTIANSFKGYQRYEFTVVRELAETSTKLAKETGGDEDIEGKEGLLFFDDFQDNVEEAEEVKSPEDEKDKKLLDVGNENQMNFEDLGSLSGLKDSKEDKEEAKKRDKEFFDFFDSLGEKPTKSDVRLLDDKVTSLSLLDQPGLSMTPTSLNPQQDSSQSFEQLSSESMTLLNDILNEGGNSSGNSTEWDSLIGDTFLPSNILKQSLGDALSEAKSSTSTINETMKKSKSDKQKGSTWLDLFAELDPLNNPSLENFSKDSSAA